MNMYNFGFLLKSKRLILENIHRVQTSANVVRYPKAPTPPIPMPKTPYLSVMEKWKN